MTDNFSDILSRDIDTLLEEMGGVPSQRVVEEKVKPVAQVQTPVVIKEDNTYINQLAANISELDDSGFHYHNKQTVDPAVDMTDRWISAIKRDEGLDEITIDPNIDVRLAAMQRQINSVANTVHTFSENTLVSGIGHGPMGQAPGGGAARLVDQDDVLIDANNLTGGEVLVWDGHYWVPTFVSGVGGDVTQILEGPGIDVDSSLPGGKGTVTISLDASLDNLNDVTIGTQAPGQVIKYNGSEYTNSYLLTSELDLTNPTRIENLINTISRNITPPTGLSTQEDANQTFAAILDALDDQVGENELEINDLKVDVEQNKNDIITINQDISAINGDIVSINDALKKKPDMTAQDTEPVAPSKDGQFYFNTVTNKLYVSKNSDWEEVSGSGGGATVIISPTEPPVAGLDDGSLWVEENTNTLYYLNNGIWIPIGEDGPGNGYYVWLKTAYIRWADNSGYDTNNIDDAKNVYVNWIIDIDSQPGSNATIVNYIDIDGSGNYKEVSDLTSQEQSDLGLTRDSGSSLTFDGPLRGGAGHINYPDCTVKMHFFHDLDPTVEVFSGEYYVFKSSPVIIHEDNFAGDLTKEIEYGMFAEQGNNATLVLRDQDFQEDKVEFIGDGGMIVTVNNQGQFVLDGSAISSGRNFLDYLDPNTQDTSDLTTSPAEGDYYEFSDDGDWEGDAVFKGDELYWDVANTVWVVYNKPVPTLDQVLKRSNTSTETIKVGDVQVLSDEITVDVRDFDNPNADALVVKFEEKDIRINGEKVTQRHILSDTEPPTTDNERGQIWIDSTNSKLYYLAEDPNDSDLNVWVEVPTGSGTVILSDTEPNTVDLDPGALWVDTDSDDLYYLDANKDWIPISTANVLFGSTAPDATDLKQGVFWIDDQFDLFVLDSDGGQWIQVSKTKQYAIDAVTDGVTTSVRLRDELLQETRCDIVGDGDIMVRVDAGQIVIDGSKLKGRNFLGYLDPNFTITLEPSPEEGDYYIFEFEGIYDGKDVNPGDELYWDGTQWVLVLTPAPDLDKVLKVGNQSNRDFEVNKGTFTGGIINLGGVDIEDTGTELTYGAEIILTDANIGTHTLQTGQLDFNGNILEVTNSQLLLNGVPIKGEGGGGGGSTSVLDDLYDVETFTNFYEAIYDISKDANVQGGAEVDTTDEKVLLNPTDDSGNSSQDLYDNSIVGTRHYLYDNNQKLSGIGTVKGKALDPTDGYFIFEYYENDFITKVSQASGSFRISVADYTNLEDGSYLSWDRGAQLWRAHKPNHSVIVSDTAPLDSTVSEGDLWYNSVNGNLYVRYVDSDSEQWVIAVTPQAPDLTDIELRLQALENNALSLVMGGHPPTTPTPKDGDLWVDEADMTMYIYEKDQWIQLTVPVTHI